MLSSTIESILLQYGRKSNLRGEFGVEIEVEGRNLPILDGNKVWEIHADHSLRGESAEYVFRIPLNKKEANTALHYLSAQLENSTIHNSNRTSVHIHRNVIPWLVQEVYTAVALYYIFETMLVRYSGEDRQGNMYCLRCSDAEYLVLLIARSITDEQYLMGGGLFGDNIRYSSLNLKPLINFGSLEFRSFRGSVDPKEIFSWMEIVSALCASSQMFYSPKGVIETFTSMLPIEFVKYCFGDLPEFMEFLLAQPDLEDSLKQGYSYAFEIAHAPKAKSPWINVVEAKKQIPVKVSSKVARGLDIPVDWNIAGMGVNAGQIDANLRRLREQLDQPVEPRPRAAPRHQFIDEGIEEDNL